MINLLLFELLDLAATLAASVVVLRSIVSRPALPASVAELDIPATLMLLPGLEPDVDSAPVPGPAAEGIEWRESAWCPPAVTLPTWERTRLAAATP